MWQKDYFAVCDNCGVVALMDGGDLPKASELASSLGWFVGRKKLLCPKCLKERKEDRIEVPLYDHNMSDKFLALLKAKPNEVLTYGEIQRGIPGVATRAYIQMLVCKMRKEHEIVTVHREGYMYVGERGCK